MPKSWPKSPCYLLCIPNIGQCTMQLSHYRKRSLCNGFALEKFRSYLHGIEVIVFSNHTSLKHLLSKKDSKPRLIKWFLLLQELDPETKDKKGSENRVADLLSRL
ncbi:hypothetical protein ACH5RR_039412 [Cinchona calisaya]|uniref:Reverse transcriptase RNase H-like domain-containing protein n=1 Tax=Cinchona calisaya TaxID=153742 RepID=A0ABD2Y1M9_9GENT